MNNDLLNDAQLWRGRLDAYGAATAAPDHLSALLGDDDQAISSALYYLDSAIVHQSTVSHAATPVLEFLVAALKSEKIMNEKARTGVIEFLAYLGESLRGASGEDYGDVEIDQELYNEFLAIKDPSEFEEFMEGEGLDLYEQVFTIAYKECAAKKDEVIGALAEVSGAENVIAEWERV
ncbi:MAG: hypothetical protein Q4D85_07270 [Corynebacterium sp.]|uniref:hypothetical protein n=1 Tax=Corynebacterium sp. TaxID=1720 RepID=UPI0026DDC9FF|nr:hypothetical protein [Corynebacterium sp.]MDO5098547.1 hypothetical protein [Corynebacterium sp.]